MNRAISKLMKCSASREVKEQVFKTVMNCSKKKSRRPHSFFGTGQTKGKTNGPTEAEREHWKSTYYLKQTTAGGADTVVTTKHLHLSKAKAKHREHLR